MVTNIRDIFLVLNFYSFDCECQKDENFCPEALVVLYMHCILQRHKNYKGTANTGTLIQMFRQAISQK